MKTFVAEVCALDSVNYGFAECVLQNQELDDILKSGGRKVPVLMRDPVETPEILFLTHSSVVHREKSLPETRVHDVSR